MKFLLLLMVLVCGVNTFQLRHNSLNNYPRIYIKNKQASLITKRRIQSELMAKNKWKRAELEGKDFFEDDDPVDPAFSSAKKKAKAKKLANEENGDGFAEKKKFKLEPETVFFEGPPSATEMLFPAISILTVIGIVPFVSAVTRQFWVKYKFTSRRISIRSGFQGNTQTDVIYSDIDQIRFVYRAFGAAGDMVLFLRDGAKVELRHVPKFNEIYSYVLSKCDEECRAKSMKIENPQDNNTPKNDDANKNIVKTVPPESSNTSVQSS